jgi:CHAT domain/SIR2-like domain
MLRSVDLTSGSRRGPFVRAAVNLAQWGASMDSRFADLEFGLVWDETQRAFDVSLRFALGSLDYIDHPKEPIDIDLEALGQLVNNDDDYAAALTQMVFQPAVTRQFYSRAAASAAGRPVHFRLHLDGPARFHDVRWETLRDPESGAPIATSRNMLLSRYLSSPDWRPIPTFPSHGTRALIVIAAPTDLDRYTPDRRRLAPVRVGEELVRARKAFAPYQSVILDGGGRATLNAVIERLNQGVDVLYVVAHGALAHVVGERPMPLLFLEQPDGTADVVDARRLVERIQDLDRRPTVVMLSSCQSAGTGDDTRSDDGGALVALGPRLASAGVPAVVAMQGNVTMNTAGDFATAFFGAFFDDGLVDRAAAVARDAVRDRPDWWVPVLFSRLRSGRTYYEAQFTERMEKTWEDLPVMIRNDLFTPVLGAGLADGILGPRQTIARRWVRRWQMPIVSHGQDNLAQVAQYLRVGRQPGRVSAYLQDYLRTELRERWENARDDDPFHGLPEDLIESSRPQDVIVEVGRRLRERDELDPYRVLAALPVKLYLTTAWTDLLEDALRARGKEPDSRSFPWTDRVDWDGEFDLPPPPTVEKPLVYHLFGLLEKINSLVLTEDDHFQWLTAWVDKKQAIPALVRKAMTNTSMVFLGYGLADWDFRVVFQSIKSFGGGERRSQYEHVGVQLRPETQMVEPEAAQRYLESYFGDDQVNIFWADTRFFLKELLVRTGIEA